MSGRWIYLNHDVGLSEMKELWLLYFRLNLIKYSTRVDDALFTILVIDSRLFLL